MGWSKRQFVEQAFNEIGLSGYIFDLSPDQLQTALRQLDAMLGTWNGKGIHLGWPTPVNPQNSDIDEETNVITWANEAIYLNLAVRLGPAFGKAVPPETKANAKSAYDVVLSIAAFPRQQQMPGTMPAGAGNKPWRRYDDNFLRQPDDGPLVVTGNDQLDFIGN